MGLLRKLRRFYLEGLLPESHMVKPNNEDSQEHLPAYSIPCFKVKGSLRNLNSNQNCSRCFRREQALPLRR